MNIKSKQVLPYVAAAVAVACGSASAATLTVTPALLSTDRIAELVTAVPSYTVGLPKLEFNLRSDAYRTGDTVSITVSGGTVSSSSAGAFACGYDQAGTGVSGTMTFSLSSISGNVLTYAVARADASKPVYLSSLTAQTCSMASSGILMVGNTLTSGVTTSVNYSALGSGITFDSLSNSANGPTANGGVGAVNVQYAFSQYSLPSTTNRNYLNELDAGTNAVGTATIVAAGNKFGTGTAGNLVTLSWQTRDEGASAGLMQSSAAIVSPTAYVSTTLTGDFSFLDDDSNGCTSADLTAGAGRASATLGGAAASLSINSACTVLTVGVASSGAANYSATNKNTASSVSFFLNGIDDSGDKQYSDSKAGRAINPQTITGTVTWKNATTATAATVSKSANFTAATWSAATSTQTGINVPYLPYGTGISRIVYLTNKGSASAVVTISGKGEAGTVCSSTNFATVTVPAGGVGLLTSAIDAGIAACLGASYAGKVNIDLSVSGSSSNVVTSAYNVIGNRINVLNSTN